MDLVHEEHGNRASNASPRPRTRTPGSGVWAAPLTVGVTGHRDLREIDRPVLVARAQAVFEGLQRACPHTPLVLLSPLAEGADRLVATVALEMGVPLIAVLPMPGPEYERDFPDSGSVEEFRTLLGRADSVIELPVPASLLQRGYGPRTEGRERLYREVGLFVARSSHVLIALWDGRANAREAGTAWVVRRRLAVPDARDGGQDPLAPAEAGVVWHVTTPRRPASGATDPIEIRELFPEGWGDEAVARAAHLTVLRQLDQFNHDAARLGASRGARTTPESGTREDRAYRAADTLALRYQSLRHAVMVAILACVVGAVAFLQLYLEFRGRFGAGLLWGYPVLLAAAALLHLGSSRAETHRKRLDYRLLAEGLRLQRAWRASGVDAWVADHHPHARWSEPDWIHHALRGAALPFGRTEGASVPETPGETAARQREAARAWMEEQRAYFPRAAHRCERRLEQVERLASWLFGSAIVIAILMVSLHRLLHDAPHLHSVLIVALGVFLATAASLSGYVERMLLREQAGQFRRMALLFGRADELWRNAESDPRHDAARRLLLELGRRVLEEDTYWVRAHRTRSLTVPKG